MVKPPVSLCDSPDYLVTVVISTSDTMGQFYKKVQFHVPEFIVPSLSDSPVSFSLLQFGLKTWGWTLGRLQMPPGWWLSGGSLCPLGRLPPRQTTDKMLNNLIDMMQFDL